MSFLGYRPEYGWSIDPFGLSSTMAYILQESLLSGMVIQRAHYAVKQYLGYKKQLEFTWKQTWRKIFSYFVLTNSLVYN